jgi:uncharacterized protein (TIGR03435 family)
MANRGDLPIRVAAVLSTRQRRGRVGTSTVAAALIASVLPGGVISPLRVGADAPARALPSQAPALPPPGAPTEVPSPLADRPLAPGPSFEVGSVRPNKAGPSATGSASVGFQPGGRFTATNITVRQLIELAYGSAGFDKSRLVGGPRWTETERFDIDARAAAGSEAQQLQAMLRSLLAERFGLLLRNEVREMPIYALVLASPDGRLGPRLQRSEDCTVAGNRKSPTATNDPAAMCGGGRGGTGRLMFGGIPLSMGLLPTLSGELQRVVVDRTGLAGFFNGSLEWMPNPLATPPPDAPPPPADAPSIFAAVQEQLGLKLQASTAPVEVFVIDSVERPTPN